MVNIRQLTDYSIAGSASSVIKRILKGGDKGEYINYEYYIIPINMLGNNITKMGYCCEVKGIAYPIFLTINGNETKFDIGKTGMFEFQDEIWKDINGDNIERTAQIIVSEVKVPKDIHFTLDYCYNI